MGNPRRNLYEVKQPSQLLNGSCHLQCFAAVLGAQMRARTAQKALWICFLDYWQPMVNIQRQLLVSAQKIKTGWSVQHPNLNARHHMAGCVSCCCCAYTYNL